MTDNDCPNGAKLSRQFRERAIVIRAGPGRHRTATDIERDIAGALERAYLDGRQAGIDETRDRFARRARMAIEAGIAALQTRLSQVREP